jgi:hypothetical protein
VPGNLVATGTNHKVEADCILQIIRHAQARAPAMKTRKNREREQARDMAFP